MMDKLHAEQKAVYDGQATCRTEGSVRSTSRFAYWGVVFLRPVATLSSLQPDLCGAVQLAVAKGALQGPASYI